MYRQDVPAGTMASGKKLYFQSIRRLAGLPAYSSNRKVPGNPRFRGASSARRPRGLILGPSSETASDAAMAHLGIVPRGRLELPSYEAVISALKNGYGVAALSRFVAAAELNAGSL